MKTIEEYIELSKNMANTSDGGSPSYLFYEDGVVLVKYRNNNEYGLARSREEKIAPNVNEKRSRGINCPAHLAIKRTKDEKYNYCYVLQERAKGMCYMNYTQNGKNNRSNDEQLAVQEIIMNQPQELYDKAVRDLRECYLMGFEAKPKNIFYDRKEGFSFIDFLFVNDKKLELDDYENANYFICTLISLYGYLSIIRYGNTYTPEQAKLNNEHMGIMQARNILAMRKELPGFSRYERTVLRKLSPSILKVMQENGIDTSDLTLKEEEKPFFEERYNLLLNYCLEQIASGKLVYWQISSNEIRNGLDRYGLTPDFFYSPDNEINREDYENDYGYETASRQLLESRLLDKFNELLYLIPEPNEYVLKAIKDKEEAEAKRKEFN